VIVIGIIGGTGFIGLNLASYLQARATPCRTFSRHGLLLNENNVYFPRLDQIRHIKGDIQDANAVNEFVRPCRCVVLVVSHLLPGSSVEEMKAVTSWFTGAFSGALEACRANSIEHLVFISSGGTIYGENHDCIPVKEDHPLNAQSGYGSFCALLEQLIHTFYHQHGLPFTVLRVANPYGLLKRTEKKQGLIDHFIRSARVGEPFTIFGTGREVRDYVYVDDLSEAISRVLDSPARNDTFNVGTGQGHATLDVLKMVRTHFNLPEVPIRFEDRRFGDVECSLLDMIKFEQCYGVRCDTSLEEGLARYAEAENQRHLAGSQ
jgi:UDP-glucose 4-epimerase